jgi:dTDP-4-amino-4,6-dideoxygalactose transaminase
VPFVRPALPSYRAIDRPLAQAFRSGILTKGPFLEAFETEVAAFLGVEHAIGVSSCTMGLLLTFKALGLEGEVLVPSYTFMATVHPLLWVGVRPVFVDVDPETWNVDPAQVRAAITERTSAIVAVHVFGNPAEVEELEAIARRYGLKLVFDAAHGFGTLYHGDPVGRYGDVEVFSTSATKLLVTGEGGVVATNDDGLAERIRVGREYGNCGDYDSQFPGLNGRMSELSAILGIESLRLLESTAARRIQLACLYMEGLGTLPGITFQKITPKGRSSYKDFTILVDESLFGMHRDCLAWALRAEGIDTRKYYDPPVHLHTTYRAFWKCDKGRLPVTERIAKRSLSLPMGSHLGDSTVVRICEAIRRIHEHARAITDRFERERGADGRSSKGVDRFRWRDLTWVSSRGGAKLFVEANP